MSALKEFTLQNKQIGQEKSDNLNNKNKKKRKKNLEGQ